MKNKPATALPWETEKLRAPNGGTYYRCGNQDDSGPVVQIFGTINGGYDAQKNAAYIVHAANAYPRAIELLKYCADHAGIGNPLKGSIKDFLRELGE